MGHNVATAGFAYLERTEETRHRHAEKDADAQLVIRRRIQRTPSAIRPSQPRSMAQPTSGCSSATLRNTPVLTTLVAMPESAGRFTSWPRPRRAKTGGANAHQEKQRQTGRRRQRPLEQQR